MKMICKERFRNFTEYLKMPISSTSKESIYVASNTYRTPAKYIQNVCLSI